MIFENGSNTKVNHLLVDVYYQFESIFNKRGLAFISGDITSDKSAQNCVIECMKTAFENRSKLTAKKIEKLSAEDCNVQ